MKNRQKQSGQAIMELLVLLLAFVVCFLGLIMIMGFSIANIEIFMEAKYNSERKAQYADNGGDGISDFKNWEYTKYELIEQPIPFLPKDKPIGTQKSLEKFNTRFNEKQNEDEKTYTFNDYSKIEPHLSIADNFPLNTPLFSFEAANLHRGKSSDFHDNNNALITDHRYFNRQKTYQSFERIIGVNLKNIDLEDNYSNTVFFPAMKLLEKGTDR